jgi:FkbM family methyltransferase
MLKRISTLLTTPGMPVAYGRWCLARMKGHGPYLPAAKNCRVSVRWVSFTEYFSVRNGIEASERRFLERCRREPHGGESVALDIGANIGQFTVQMAASGFRCHSFEPTAATFERLGENVTASGFENQVKCIRMAVGDRTGEVEFYTERTSPATNGLSPRPDGPDAGGKVVHVPMTTVDAYLAAQKLERIDVMKVDVEGFEAAVFRGAKETLGRRAVRAILFEVCPTLYRRAGESGGSLLGLLRDLGYCAYRLDDDGECGDELGADALDQMRLANVVAVPR